MTRRKTLMWLGAGLAVAGAGGAIWGATKAISWLSDDDRSNQDCGDRLATKVLPDKLALVAKNAGLVLPANCTWLDGYHHAWTEWTVCARFLVPVESLDAFIRDSKLTTPQPGLRPDGILNTGNPAVSCDSQWHPEKPVKVSGIDTEDLGPATRTLMLDLDQAATAMVYLVIVDTDVS